MCIYLSEFRVLSELSRDPAYDRVVRELVELCNSRELKCFRSHTYDSYDAIEDRIRRSLLLIAVVDRFWTSSTWKFQELCFAVGDVPPIGADKTPAERTSAVVVRVGDLEENPNLDRLARSVTISDIPAIIDELDSKSCKTK